jgi:hypothetical protein
MHRFVVRSAGKKGKGLFTTVPLTADDCLFSVDLSCLEPPPPDAKLSKEEWDHLDYSGRGRYVISTHPYVYINHDCDPNVYVMHHTIARSSFYALRDIRAGEELTYDYGVNAMDQFRDMDFVFECACGSTVCRKKVHTNFFKQPLGIQRRYARYIPPSIKHKYRERFLKLRQSS